MNSLIVFLLVGVSITQGVSYQELVNEQWQDFKHGKVYESEYEEFYRQSVFMDNLYKINKHNKRYETGLESFKMGMNHLGDLTANEFLRFYTMQRPKKNLNSTYVEKGLESLSLAVDESLDHEINGLPTEINWKKKGYVTPVKDQTSACGSCWSFSATGSLEGQWFKKTGKLVSLSEQNLIDCSGGKYHNSGCEGGLEAWAFKYIIDNGGIDTEKSYPYEARDGPCRYRASNKGAFVSRIKTFRGENKLKSSVATVGPISAGMAAGETFQFYHSGIIGTRRRCGRDLNHSVLVVGYGSEAAGDYWLVKNSYGASWGEHGYFRIARNKNMCGIADDLSYPVV